MPSLFIIAGERSGDLHAANLVSQLKKIRPDLKVRGVGGSYLEAQGVDMLFTYDALNYMGLVEVLVHIRDINKRLNQVCAHLNITRPTAVILVDSAGFNLRVAKYCKSLNIRVIYYILPKVWAWGKGRIPKLKKYVDDAIVILPFEKAYFGSVGVKVQYFGNPITDQLARFHKNPDFKERYGFTKPIIAVLPGSRKQEVNTMLKQMIAIAPSFPNYQFAIACVQNLPNSIYALVPQSPQFKLILDNTYNILTHAEAAIVASGTATLETALLHIPQVVCYRTSAIFIFLARRVIKVKYISLVNLIANKEVVRELIQDDFNSKNLVKEIKMLLPGGSKRQNVLEGYQEVDKLTGKPGASQRAAEYILNVLC